MPEQLILGDVEGVNASGYEVFFVYKISKIDAILVVLSTGRTRDPNRPICKRHGGTWRLAKGRGS